MANLLASGMFAFLMALVMEWKTETMTFHMKGLMLWKCSLA